MPTGARLKGDTLKLEVYLRFSDVKALTWDMVKSFADGSKYLDFLAVKTTRQNIVPINDDVLNLMGKRSSGKVFKGLLYYMTQKTMQEWLRAAKIQKHITFHCFRHIKSYYSLRTRELQKFSD